VKTWDEIDLLVDTDPLALRDLAWRLQNSLGVVTEALGEMVAGCAPEPGDDLCNAPSFSVYDHARAALAQAQGDDVGA
jgi:hypothetical protein